MAAKCVFRKIYVTNDKIGVKCTNWDYLAGLGIEDSGMPVRITCSLVCADCRHRQTKLPSVVTEVEEVTEEVEQIDKETIPEEVPQETEITEVAEEVQDKEETTEDEELPEVPKVAEEVHA